MNTPCGEYEYKYEYMHNIEEYENSCMDYDFMYQNSLSSTR